MKLGIVAKMMIWCPMGFVFKDAKEGFIGLTFEARESLKVVIEPQT